MTWTQQLQHVGRGENEIQEEVMGSYKGLPVYAALYIHEKALSLLKEKVHNKNASILVLGAGSGAFDERLYDAGYTNISVCEYNDDVYKGRFVNESKDLNKDFSYGKSFDCIIALELVEHLENHFHFLRECEKTLSEGGVLIVSTPHVESSLSRVKFFLRGDLNYFSKKEMLHTGHINPVFSMPFVYYAESIGLTLLSKTKNISVWNMKQYRKTKQKINIALLSVLSLLQKNKDDTQIALYVFRKSK